MLYFIVFIIVWLILGVIGAYIGHVYCDYEIRDTPLWLTLFGPLTLLASISYIIANADILQDILNRPLFKKKY